MASTINLGGLFSPQATTSDFKPYPQIDKRYGPYTSTSEVLTSLPKENRCIGLTIGVVSASSIEEYWFKDGIEDSNLVKKAEDSYQTYREKGGTKTEEEFYSTLKQIIDSSAFINISSNISEPVKVEISVDNDPSEVVVSGGEDSSVDTSSTQAPSTLAYLEIESKDLNDSLPDEEKTVNISISNAGGEFSKVLDSTTPMKLSYSGMGGSRECIVTISIPDSTFKNVLGIYDTETGELLTNNSIYAFKTPNDGQTFLTIKFNK